MHAELTPRSLHHAEQDQQKQNEGERLDIPRAKAQRVDGVKIVFRIARYRQQ
jgi:hypothetical protein